MARKKQIADNSTTSNEPVKNVFDEYYNFRTFKKQVTSSTWAQRVSEEMIKWAEEDPEAFVMNEFYRLHGIQRNDITRLSSRYPQLQQAHAYCLEVLGNKREKGAAHVGVKKQWDPAVIMPSLGRFDPDYKEFMEWKAKIAKDAEESKQTIVIMKDMPRTDIVPEKK